MSRARATSPYPDTLPPPINVEAEQALLGAVLINNAALDRVSSFLRPEHFHDAAFQGFHSELYGVIYRMVSAGQLATPITVKSAFPSDLTIGDLTINQYLARLVTDATTIINAVDYAETIVALAGRRALMEAGNAIAEIAALSAPDVKLSEVIRECEARLAEAIEGRGEGTSAGPVVGMMDQLADAFRRDGTDAIRWFLREVQHVLGDDLEFGWLIGLLADSGGGKTSVALQQAAHAIFQHHPVLFLSGDQKPEEVVRQIISQQLGIESGKLRRGRISEQEYSRVIEKAKEVERWPLDIRRIGRPTTNEIAMWVRAWQRKHGRRGLVVIDHAKRLQPSDRRAMLSEGVNQVYGDLKALMQETDNVGLILMQRNTDGAKRDNPRPHRGDVYGGSSALESLDACLALYVEEHWTRSRLEMARTDKQRQEIKDRAAVMLGKAELIGLKARFAKANECRVVKREAEFTRFVSEAVDWRGDEPEMAF